MDKLISSYDGVHRKGLCYCFQGGVAYQIDMQKSVPYELEYFKKYLKYEVTPLGHELNRLRMDLVKPWAKGLRLIDIGPGCGSFIKTLAAAGIDAYGYDINPVTAAWLKDNNFWANPYRWSKKYFCWTFWDSLEHIPDPGRLLEKIPVGSYVFVSLPIFERLEDIEKSKHYRPNEHYYYFTQTGFLRWMKTRRFKLMNILKFETELGRESIKTYCFERVAKLKMSELFAELLTDYLGIRREEKYAV